MPLFESPKSEAQPVWERIPPEARDIYTRALREFYNRALAGPPPTLRPRLVDVEGIMMRGFDPTQLPGMQQVLAGIQERARLATGPMMQTLALAGQGPGTPMAQAAGQVAGSVGEQVGKALLQGTQMSLEQARELSRQLLQQEALRQAAEQQYYLIGLRPWEQLMQAGTGLMGAFLPPPQYGEPPIVGLLPFLGLFFPKS